MTEKVARAHIRALQKYIGTLVVLKGHYRLASGKPLNERILE